MSTPLRVANPRGVCGRYYGGPLLPHRAWQWVYMEGKPLTAIRLWRGGRLWDRFKGRRSVYRCEEEPGHQVVVLRPARKRWTVVTHTYADGALRPAAVRRIRELFEREGRISGVMEGVPWKAGLETVQVERPSIELGHHYFFNRYL